MIFDNYVKTYYYTYQLCNADWKPVDLSTFDYIDGFSQNRLIQYRPVIRCAYQICPLSGNAAGAELACLKKAATILLKGLFKRRYLEACLHQKIADCG